MPARSGKAQSCSSITTPCSAPSAGVISSSDSTTGWSLPSRSPFAIRKTRLYPIWPAAPVTATRTGFFMSVKLALGCDLVGGHRQEDRAGLGQLGDARRGAGGHAAAVGMRVAQEAAEPAIDVVALHAH